LEVRVEEEVMFMTFIAVSILSTIFLTYYLYLTQQSLSASEAQRIYAEAAQEKIEVILDRRGRTILVNNTGGIGAVIRYLVGLDRSGATASLWEPLNPIIVPAGGYVVLVDDVNATFPEGELYIMTERGNLFKAIPGGFHLEIEAYPSNITLGNASSAVITLKLKAALLETPEEGVILVVADPSGCMMTNITTTTRIDNITYSTTTIIAASKTEEGWICADLSGKKCKSWTYVTFVAEPITMTVAADVSAVYTTETLTRSDEWIEPPEPITLTFTTRTRTTMTTITISARTLDYWDENAQCFIWFRVLNATSGSKLAEAGVRASAGTAIATTTETTTETTTPTPYVEINVIEDNVEGEWNDEKIINIEVISHNGYEGDVTLSYSENPSDVIHVPSGKDWGFNPDRVTLSAGGSASATFRFRIKGNGIVTITGSADPPATVISDQFTVTLIK